ncbi:MAG: 4-(cytidine 5'-diphospho)-2-C-methyl-D-erythritol kinase, partial [Gammaproteobacteria bacterium]
MTELTLPAPAKLNLFLHITSGPICQGHKPGYHHLETLFQLISLSDVLRFRRSRSRAIGLHCPGLNTPAADNLVTRAAHALQAHTHCTYGADITVNKCLPAGGGLGGGSSDAATTLLALNVLWDLRLNLDTLADIGRTLGADVPVFIRGHTAHATGMGDKLTPCQQPPLWFVLVKPRASIATADVFRHPALPRQTPPFFSDVPPFCAPTSTF